MTRTAPQDESMRARSQSSSSESKKRQNLRGPIRADGRGRFPHELIVAKFADGWTEIGLLLQRPRSTRGVELGRGVRFFGSCSLTPSKLPGRGRKRIEMSPRTGCFRAWLPDAALCGVSPGQRTNSERLPFGSRSRQVPNSGGQVIWREDTIPCTLAAPFDKAEYQRKSKSQFITNRSGRSRAAWLASCHLGGADSPRDDKPCAGRLPDSLVGA
jgi:hypothetical protein